MPYIDLPPAEKTFAAPLKCAVAGYVIGERVPFASANTMTAVTGGGDPAWFLTPEWQAREDEADADIAAGRFRRHMSDEEFLGSL